MHMYILILQTWASYLYKIVRNFFISILRHTYIQFLHNQHYHTGVIIQAAEHLQ